MFLLIADAHSKWVDIHISNSSTSATTIKLLRKTFASLGLPEVLVSDNTTAFTSTEFAEFLERNGIRHVRTPPYHPASNGLVERAVQSFKAGMKRLKEGSLNTRLSRYLYTYRTTPHSTTGVSPAEMLFGRKMHTLFDRLSPSVEETARRNQERQRRSHDLHSRPRSFTEGETVYAKNYGQGPKWLPGCIVEILGSVMYRVCLTDERLIWRHVDQLRPREANAVGDSTAGEIPIFQSPDSNVESEVTPIPESSAEEEAALAEVENEQPEQSLERDQSDKSHVPETSETARTQA